MPDQPFPQSLDAGVHEVKDWLRIGRLGCRPACQVHRARLRRMKGGRGVSSWCVSNRLATPVVLLAVALKLGWRLGYAVGAFAATRSSLADACHGISILAATTSLVKGVGIIFRARGAGDRLRGLGSPQAIAWDARSPVLLPPPRVGLAVDVPK